MKDGMRIVHEEDGMTFVEFVADPATIEETLAELSARGAACARGGALAVSLVEGDL